VASKSATAEQNFFIVVCIILLCYFDCKGTKKSEKRKVKTEKRCLGGHG